MSRTEKQNEKITIHGLAALATVLAYCFVTNFEDVGMYGRALGVGAFILIQLFTALFLSE